MPIPPPPPPGPPPPPMNFGSSTPGVNDKSALLQSIRAGTTLKKTVTRDRSSPAVSGKVANSNNSNFEQLRPNFKGVKLNGSATIARSNGFGGIFADGKPKFKSTNLSISHNHSSSLNSLNDSNSISSNNLSETRLSVDDRISNLRSELEAKIEERIGRKKTFDPKNRGPPPQPPVQKPILTNSISDTTLTGNSGGHVRSMSSVGLKGATLKLKPQLAPKPPAPPPPNLSIVDGPRRPPTRAQSMRVPASPPILSSISNGPFLSVAGSDLNKSGFHSSTGSLLDRRMRQPIKHPTEKPPPPPPRCQPPPIPAPPVLSIPPPPPPQSQPPITRELPPPPSALKNLTKPSFNNNNNVINKSNNSSPLPVPTRHSSMIRPTNGVHNSAQSDFEYRFSGNFHAPKDFPPPQPFIGFGKVYNSKTAKAQAPLPPAKLQISNKSWSNDSSC